MMNRISQRLNEDIALIDGQLKALLSEDLLPTDKENGQKGSGYFRELFAFENKAEEQRKPLADSMEYSLMSGGKRIRPVLTLEFSRLFGGSDKVALRMGAALEMVHTYSLIHDDLPCMDNDDYRRGKLTNHKVYGEATAVLAGDALLTRAFSVLAQNKDENALRYLDAIQILAESAGSRGMVGGQQIDLAGEKTPLTKAQQEEMTLRKTGELIRAACLMGCASAGADETKRRAAEKYAYGIGLAFQIIDDLLDMGTEDEKTTFLTFYTPEEAKKYAKTLTENAIDAVKDYEGSDFLVSLAEALYERKI